MKKETANKILEQSKQGYNTIAKEFAQTRNYQWEEFDVAEDYVKENDNVLDLGCGNGRFVYALKNKNINYTGVDSSSGLIEIAKQNYPDKNFIVNNALETPFKDSFFDSVFSFAVLHHIPSKNYRKKFIQESGRILKKDGYLILTAWNMWQKKYIPTILLFAIKNVFGLSKLDIKDVFLGFNKRKNVRFLHAFTKHELKKLLKKNGFKIIKLKTTQKPSGQSNFLVIAQNKK